MLSQVANQDASSTLMPLLFGVSGAWVGASGLFWAVGALVGAGSRITRGFAPAAPGGGDATRRG